MNDDLTPVPQGGGTNQLVNLRNLTLITYGLHPVPVRWYYRFGGHHHQLRQTGRGKGTYLESHFDWQIRTFWWGLVGVCLSFLLMTILIGFVTIAIVGVWILYRLIKGLLAVNDGKPIA